MRQMTLLAAIALMAYGTGELEAGKPTHSGNRFHVGGSKTTQGRVTVRLNGGAGKHPRFHVHGTEAHHARSHRDSFVRSSRRFRDSSLIASGGPSFVGSYPVAVGGGFGSGHFGDGGFSNLYNQGFIPVPPYYALHPPVYYSVPVPRTYGYSPFAYPGTVPTPEVSIQPADIINPYVDPAPAPDLGPEEVPAPTQETSDKTATLPPVIHNPFVHERSLVSFTEK